MSPRQENAPLDKALPTAKGANLPKGLELSFAGCGFLGIYHVGASACLRQCAPDLPIAAIGGASAGAMAGACLLAEADLGAIRSSIIGAAAAARSSMLGPFSPSFSIHSQLRAGLSQVLPEDAHTRVNGRLVVSLTRVSDGQNVRVSTFSSRQELIEVLLCSSFIPLFSGLRPGRVAGARCVDGGFSDNCPVTSPAAVTVSPFAGEADVCPADASASVLAFSITNTNLLVTRRNVQRVVHALFPPSPEALRAVCQQGFDDMLAFLQKHGLVSCPRCARTLARATTSCPQEAPSVDSCARSKRQAHEDEGLKVDTATSLKEDGPSLGQASPEEASRAVRGQEKAGHGNEGWGEAGHVCGGARGVREWPAELAEGGAGTLSCYDCSACRNLLQESLMMGPKAPPYEIPRSLVAITYTTLTLPLTLPLSLQCALVRRVVGMLPLAAVVRLYHLAAAAVGAAASVVERRRAVAGATTPGLVRRRAVAGAAASELARQHAAVYGASSLAVQFGSLKAPVHRQDEDLVVMSDGIHDVLESSLRACYFEEGQMTECWALTTLLTMLSTPSN